MSGYMQHHSVRSSSKRRMAASDTSEELHNLDNETQTIKEFLFSTHVILDCIFKNLPFVDLLRCSTVCKLWNEVAKRHKLRRCKMFWMYKVWMKNRSRFDLHFNSCIFSRFVANYKAEIENCFIDILNNAPSYPKHAIIFCSCKLYDQFHKYFTSFNPQMSYVSHYHEDNTSSESNNAAAERAVFTYGTKKANFIAQHLPKHCKLTLCSIPGIIGTSSDNVASYEAENIPAFSAAFIPNVPGVEVYHFSIGQHEVNLSNVAISLESAGHSPDYRDHVISNMTKIPTDRQVKCLLLLSQDVMYQTSVPYIIKYYLKKQNYKLAMGGAVVEQIDAPFLNEDNHESVVAVGIAFCGDNVTAASIVLEVNVSTPKMVEREIRKLKFHNISEQYCFAFMFACCGRGVSYYKELNVEAEIFRKVFPSVPLFGVFGNGEYGINYIPKPDGNPRKKIRHPHSITFDRNSFVNSYTTTFVLISVENVMPDL